MILRSLIGFLALAICFASLSAQTGLIKPRKAPADLLPRNPQNAVPPPPAVSTQVKEFFLALQANSVEDAYRGIMKDSIVDDKDYKVKNLVSQTKNLNDKIGILNGYELYDNRNAGNRIISLTYFSYHKKMPLRWRFIFYAGTVNQWRLINLSVDDLVVQTLLES